MSERGWRVAQIASVPTNADIPVPGSTLTRDQERVALRERDPAFIERVEKLTARFPTTRGTWHAVRRHFGITSFGVNASEAPEGEPLIVPHDERQYGLRSSPSNHLVACPIDTRMIPFYGRRPASGRLGRAG